MFRRLHRLTATHASRAAIVLAVLAVTVRLLLAAAPMPAAVLGQDAAVAQGDALAALLSGQGICHGDADAPAGNAPVDATCQLCPLCVGLGTPLPAGEAAPPVAVVVLAGAVPLPPISAGPPTAPFSLARPRGPPARSA